MKRLSVQYDATAGNVRQTYLCDWFTLELGCLVMTDVYEQRQNPNERSIQVIIPLAHITMIEVLP